MLRASRRHVQRLQVVAVITVIRNPSNDSEFANAIDELLAQGVISADDAQRRLRERWPRAVVRLRGLSDEVTPVWYAQREGRWIPADRKE
jgi:hypothetical protein